MSDAQVISDVALFFGGIISLIYLIVFFVMASNIAKIKEEMRSIRRELAPEKQDYFVLAERAVYRGDNAEAIKHLKNLRYSIKIWIDLKSPPAMYKQMDEKARKRIEQLENEKP